MNTKRLTITLLVALAMSTIAMAQQRPTAREELKANRFLSASNYLDYDNYPATVPLTPAPRATSRT